MPPSEEQKQRAEILIKQTMADIAALRIDAAILLIEADGLLEIANKLTAYKKDANIVHTGGAAPLQDSLYWRAYEQAARYNAKQLVVRELALEKSEHEAAWLESLIKDLEKLGFDIPENDDFDWADILTIEGEN